MAAILYSDLQGEEELIYMGERMVARFPKLLSDYHSEHFLFRNFEVCLILINGLLIDD